MSLIETLLADAEHLVESDFPSTGDLRKVVGALLKRFEQTAVIEHTESPAPAEPDPPAPLPDASASSELDQVLTAVRAMGQQLSSIQSEVDTLKASPAASAPPVTLVPDAPDAPAPDAPGPVTA